MKLTGSRIHFMGIGGIGMCALAHMAKHAGAVVTGCDRAASAVTAGLENAGIPVFIGHDPAHFVDMDFIVYTSAIPPDHPERLAAGSRQEKRGSFLARFMNESEGIGVSGAHGKTTTSWLLAQIAMVAGLDPTVFIGGMASELPDGNFRVGDGPFIAELDESDESFLLPQLRIAVITNIESDHLSHYGDDESLYSAFRRYAEGVAREGSLVIGIDSPVADGVYLKHTGKKLSFGFKESVDLRATNVREKTPGENLFSVCHRGEDWGEFSLPLPGRHNVLNALAALGASLEMGIPPETARRALASATGVGRRLERLCDIAGVVLYSDYAHHPTEVAASITALKQRHPRGVLTVFQPHLYSRTRDYVDAFANALALSDGVVLVDIYPAREEPIPGVTSELLASAARDSGIPVRGPFALAEAGAVLPGIIGDFEAVVFMGAGDIDGLARTIARTKKWC